MKDTQFAITLASKSPTGNTTTTPRSTTGSNSTASERRLGLQAILSEIDGTVRYLMPYTWPKKEHKPYFIYNTELKHDVTRILTRLTT